MTSAPRTARERARAELTAEITATARRHLADHGPGELSLRAVARELGMASSALYRYFPSRDALLTALIIEAYDEMGQACEDAERAIDRSDVVGRLRAIAGSARAWALSNPNEYGLIYGTPIPGYAAPQDTVDPASRVVRLMVELAIDIDRLGHPPVEPLPVPPLLSDQIEQLLGGEQIVVDEQRFLALASVWALLFGMISFEVFGRYTGMFDDGSALFDHEVDRAALSLGIPPELVAER